MLSAVTLLAVFVLFAVTSAQNDFDAIRGCRQYSINRPSYNNPNPYYALDQFRDYVEVNVPGLKIQSIKLAVMGSNDGVIRLSPVDQPYQNTLMDEIVISGWGNTRHAVRQYRRSSPSRYSNARILVNQLSGGVLAPYRLFVFRLSIVNDHLVALSKEGESLPFLQYTDAGVIPKYIGFSNWNAPVSVFYDCPPPEVPVPPTTAEPVTTTTAEPVTATTVNPEITTTAEPVTATTVNPEITTTAEPVTATTVNPEITTTAEPVTATTVNPEITTTAEPEQITTVDPETTTADPEQITTAEPEASTVDPEDSDTTTTETIVVD